MTAQYQVCDEVRVMSTEYWAGGSINTDSGCTSYVGRRGVVREVWNYSNEVGKTAYNYSVECHLPSSGLRYDTFADVALRPYKRKWTDAAVGDEYVEHIVNTTGHGETLRQVEWTVMSLDATHVELHSPDGWIHRRPLNDVPLGEFQ